MSSRIARVGCGEVSRSHYLYVCKRFDTINTQSFHGKHIDPVSNRIRIILENVILPLGVLMYWRNQGE